MSVEKETGTKLKAELGRILTDHCQDIENKLTAFQIKYRQAFDELLDTIRAATEDVNSVDTVAERIVAELVSGLRRDQITAFGDLNRSIFKIRQQQTQSDILTALLEGASLFSPRVALFITRGDSFIGWQARGFSGGLRNDLIKTVSLPKTADTVLKAAIESRRTLYGDALSHAENTLLLEKFGAPEPRKMVVVPLVINRKTPAVLYADCGDGDENLINLEALEVLSQATCLTVENLALSLIQEKVPIVKDAPREPVISERGPSGLESATVEGPAVQHLEMPPVAPELHPEVEVSNEAVQVPAFEKPVETEPRRGEPIPFTPPVMEEPSEEIKIELVTEPKTALAVEEVPAPTVAAADREVQREETIPAEDEKLYSEAKRCARLVVTEIRMYNEQKVVEGRRNRDLYTRLKPEIDRGREWYEKRVSAKVRSKVDYFHDYLVQILGDSDSAALGKDYPGPKIGSHN